MNLSGVWGGGILDNAVIWRGQSLRLRGTAAELSGALSSLIYLPNVDAGGEDSVFVSLGAESSEVSLYVRRKAPDLAIVAKPLLNITAGNVLLPEIKVTFSHVAR